MHHFVKRGCDQSGQADHLRLLAACRVENMLATDHDTEVDDLEVVTLQDHPDNVLADIVHVTLHCRHDDLAIGADLAVLFLLDERHEVTDGLFHDACRLDDLRQEHLAVAEQITDDVHACHQRSLDNGDRPVRRQTSLLGVVDDEFVDTVDECMLQSFLDRQVTPGKIFDLALDAGLLVLVTLGDLE